MITCHMRALLGEWPLHLAFSCNISLWKGLGAGDAAIWTLYKDSLLVWLYRIQGTLKLIVIEKHILIRRGQVYPL